MALNGLEKITGKILSEAQAKADKILADAQAECDRISADYADRAEQIRQTLSDEAEKAGLERVSRVKSTAATSKRNYLMQTKSELIDSVFESALQGTLHLDPEKYTALLVGLLSAALLEQLEAEHTVQMLYTEEEQVLPVSYEILMNQRERERFGKAVLEETKKKFSGKVAADRLEKLKLSDKTAPIDGGLVLRCGDVETNCSLSILFAQLREELEGEVMRALFEVKAPTI